jgi:DNA-binding LacI/PurR family transcriptional regulator
MANKAGSIHSELRRRLLDGEWEDGERLPSESEFAETFSCSIGTVSKAVSLLVHDGIVRRSPRTGIRASVGAGTPADFSTSERPGAFAFIYPSAQHESTRRMMKSFERISGEHHRQVVAIESGVIYQRKADFIRRLLNQDIRGTAIAPSFDCPEDLVHFSWMLLSSPVPVVMVGTPLHGIRCPAVAFDAFHAGYSAVVHLIERGAKNIGFITNEASVTRQYYDGFLWALDERGLPLREDLVLRDNSIHPNFENPFDEPTRLGHRYLSARSSYVDGVVCVNDYLAQGLRNAATALGRKVPQDLRIVGLEGLRELNSPGSPLTSYQFPFEEAGRTAYAMLESLVGGEDANLGEIKLRGQVIPGATS